MTSAQAAAAAAADARPGFSSSASLWRVRSTVRWEWLAVAALMVLALALRLVLAHDSLLGDELFMYAIVHDQSLGHALSVIRHTEKTPPLFFVLSWLTIRIGDPTVWIRLPSLVCGTLSVPLAYALGTRVRSRSAGVAAAAFVALAPFGLYYSVNARAYAGLAFFSALSTLCLLNAVDTNRKRWWAGYVIATVAVLYTHYMGAFVLLVQAVWAFWTHRKRIRELVVAHVLVAIAFAPWIPSFLLQQSHSGAEAARIAALSPVTFPRFVQYNEMVLFAQPGSPLHRVPGLVGVVLAVVLIVLGLTAAAMRWWRREDRSLRLSSPLLLLAVVTVASPIGVLLLSLRPHKSFLLPRNLSASWIAAEVVLACLLVSLHRRLALVAVAAMVAVFALGASGSLRRENRNSQYLAAAHFIDARARPGDPVLQHFFLNIHGPLANVLTIDFKHPHSVVAPGGDDANAWARARRGAHVFVVQPLPGFFRKVRHLPRWAGPGKRFVLLDEGRWTGIEDILVGVYGLPRR